MPEFTSASPLGHATLSRTPTVRLAQQGAVALGIKLAGAAVALALQVSLARLLGQSGYGEFAYVFAWQQLLLLLAQSGLATAALRFAAEYRARGQSELLCGFLAWSTKAAVLTSAALALLMAGFAAAWCGPDAAGSVTGFLIAAATLPVLAQYALRGALLRGLGHVIPSMLVTLAYPLAFLAAVLASTLLLHNEMTSRDALTFNLAAALCGIGAVVATQYRLQGDATRQPQSHFRTTEWLTTATHMTLASSLIFIQGRTGVIVSGLLLDARAAGTYAAMERLADVALLGLMSVNMLAAPTFARLHAQQRTAELQRYARLAAWGSTSVMLAAAVPLVLFGRYILRCFGDEFVAGYPVLVVLLGGVAVNAACGSVGYLLSMTGHHRLTVYMALLGLCLNVTLSFILVPQYGIIGTAVANAASIALWNVAMLLVVRHRLGVWACIGSVA